MYFTNCHTVTTTCMLTTHNFSSLSIHRFLTPASLSSSILFRKYLFGWLLIFQHSTLLKLNFFLSASHNNLPKLIPSHWLLFTLLATLVLFLTNTSLSLTKYLFSLKSCHYHIRELRCLRPYLDFKTVSTIATSIVHSKLDYWSLQLTVHVL